MNSLTGREPVSLSPQEIADSWEEGLRPIKAVHHQAGNYRVHIDGDDAQAFCYGIAFRLCTKISLRHRLPNNGRAEKNQVGGFKGYLAGLLAGVWVALETSSTRQI